MKKKDSLSNKDAEVWKEYIKNPNDIFDKEASTRNQNKKRSIKFDLHGYTLEEANVKVSKIINDCIRKKIYEIILITGKGLHSNTEKNVYASNTLSKLKHSVPDYIKTNSELSKLIYSINTAPKEEGGKGAIIIKLKKL